MEASSPQQFFEPILKDVLALAGNPETHSYIELKIIKPILQRVFQHLYPYIMGVMTLWILMFLCMAVILLMLVRGSLMEPLVRI
jgi:hypothetical protein